MGQQRIQERVCKLTIVLRIVHTELVFRTGPNDELIDQRIAFTIYLPPLAFAIELTAYTTNGDSLPGSGSVSSNHRVLVSRWVNLAISGRVPGQQSAPATVT